jgi:hypothetical protein
MKIISGYSRIVIVFDKYVVKIARIKFIEAKESVFSWFGRGLFPKAMIKHPDIFYRMLESLLLLGVLENWHEYRLYKKTKLAFLVPTYFSLLGLINIQRRGVLFEMDTVVLWYQMVRISNNEVWDHPHHFCNPANFCKTNGKLQMLDYGSFRSHRVIKKYGEKMQREFDFNLTREQLKW